MILRILVLCIFFISSIHCLKLHEHMTKEEIESVFNCKHDEVHKLEYEVVPVLHENDNEMIEKVFGVPNPTIKLEAFNQSYTLYLESNNNVLYGSASLVYKARQAPSSSYNYDRVEYNWVQSAIENIEAYHDVKNRAAVTIHRDANNRSHVDGLIGDDIIIRSLPTRIHEEVLNKYPNLHEPIDYTDHVFIGTTTYTHTLHIVQQTSSGSSLSQFQGQRGQVDDNPFGLPNLPTPRPYYGQNPYYPTSGFIDRPVQHPYGFPTLPPLNYFPQNIYTPTSAFKPTTASPPTGNNYYPPIECVTSPAAANDENIVYPEIILIIDYDTYKTHGSNVQSVLKYMLAFWNGVDLRYRELQDPKVRLNIARIIIAEEPNGAPYMQRNIVSEVMLADHVLDDMKEYFINQINFQRSAYDVVISLTTRDLESRNVEINGLAVLGGACSDNAGAIILDKGGFNGITTAAHELGHLLNALHDKEVPEELNGPCPGGYLMSSYRPGPDGVHWSKCSKMFFRTFMKSSRAMCLKNKPNTSIYRKILPGTVLSRDEQCQKLFDSTYSSFKMYDGNCTALICANFHYIDSLRKPPAEGSSCSGGGVCLDGNCVIVPREFDENNYLVHKSFYY